jgi:4-oxalocrotonate tautomerase
MPILKVKVSAEKSATLTENINAALLDLTTSILRKKRELTSIVIEYVDPTEWSIGGVSLSSLGKKSFYFDITITDETNTKDEKAEYINAAFQAFENLLGEIHEESYIYIQDARAAAYGYGGLTQEYRFHHSL